VSKLIPLQVWAQAQYGEHAPSIGTLRRWAHDGKIYPHPKKHGRSYFVEPDAEYVDDYNSHSFMEKVHAASLAKKR
jgi:predicted site-specific integrase-resolvase